MNKVRIRLIFILIMLSNNILGSTQLIRCSYDDIVHGNIVRIFNNTEGRPSSFQSNNCKSIANFPTRSEFVTTTGNIKNQISSLRNDVKEALNQNKKELRLLVLDAVDSISDEIVTEDVINKIENDVTKKLLLKINELQQQVIELQKKVN